MAGTGEFPRQVPAILERTTGFEPATPTLARLCSTTEPRPRDSPILTALAERARPAGSSVFKHVREEGVSPEKDHCLTLE